MIFKSLYLETERKPWISSAHNYFLTRQPLSGGELAGVSGYDHGEVISVQLF